MLNFTDAEFLLRKAACVWFGRKDEEQKGKKGQLKTEYEIPLTKYK